MVLSSIMGLHYKREPLLGLKRELELCKSFIRVLVQHDVSIIEKYPIVLPSKEHVVLALFCLTIIYIV